MKRWGWTILKRIGVLLAVGGVFLIAFSAGNEAPIADYGDAPDGLPAGYTGPFERVIGHFPTLYTNQGAHTLEVPLEEAAFLGDQISWEVDAADPEDPDGTPNLIWDDFNDGVEIDPPATLVFKVTIGPQAPEITRYINVLIDLDRSGAWDREDEWVIKNLPAEVASGGSREISQELPSPIIEALTKHLSPAWMRVALTSSPIDETVLWDGSGEFTSGEIEDYPIVGVEQGMIAIASAEAVAKVAARARAFADAMTEAQARVAAAVEAIAEAEAEAEAYVAVKIPPVCARARARIPPVIAEAEAEVEAYVKKTVTACESAADWVEAIAEAEAKAHAYVEKTAHECERAADWDEDFDQAIKTCRDYDHAWEAVCHTVSSFQQRVETLTAQIPCATVVANFKAAAEAIAEACAAAEAEAESMASAWSEAYAGAESFAEACADALAIAEAHAEAIAEAYADAEAYAEACAEALAIAEAYAEAYAEAIAAAESYAEACAEALAIAEASAEAIAEAKATALTAAEAVAKAVSIAESSARAAAIAAAQATAAVQAKGLSLAFGRQIEQTLAVLSAPVANALAAALTAAEAAAQAAAQAQAAALAAMEAQARAEAEVDVLAAVYARAEAYAEAIAEAIATAEAVCKAKSKAIALANAVSETMTSLEGAITAIPSGNCPREICRLDPPPVTVTITTTVIKKECEEECWTVCGGYEYEECWLECVATECEEVEKTISGLKILVNGNEYEAPITIQEDMKSDLHLEAPATYTETIISIWPPSISITIYGFSYWECNGVRTRNRSYAFTLNGNVTCKAVYGAQ